MAVLQVLLLLLLLYLQLARVRWAFRWRLRSAADGLLPLSCPTHCCAALAPQGHTIGVLNTGHSFNANGLQRHALPAHLPPALTSSPFSWVTLDMGAMLADPLKEPDAPAWVCAYLSLVSGWR